MSPASPAPIGPEPGRPDPDEPMLLFVEEGSSWWPVLVGPLLALGGGLLESTAPGGVAWGLWIVMGVVVGAVTALVVRARRRFLRVELTPEALRQGSEVLPLADVVAVRPDDGSGNYGVRVLGDGPVVPRKYEDVLLVLRDGAYRLAWAKDGEGLRRALALVVDTPAADGSADPGPTADR